MSNFSAQINPDGDGGVFRGHVQLDAAVHPELDQ